MLALTLGICEMYKALGTTLITEANATRYAVSRLEPANTMTYISRCNIHKHELTSHIAR